MDTPHAHEWRLVVEQDHCHWTVWGFDCACGAQRRIVQEVAVPRIPSDGCGRCHELEAGAAPRRRDLVLEPGVDIPAPLAAHAA